MVGGSVKTWTDHEADIVPYLGFVAMGNANVEYHLGKANSIHWSIDGMLANAPGGGRALSPALLKVLPLAATARWTAGARGGASVAVLSFLAGRHRRGLLGGGCLRARPEVVSSSSRCTRSGKPEKHSSFMKLHNNHKAWRKSALLLLAAYQDGWPLFGFRRVLSGQPICTGANPSLRQEPVRLGGILRPSTVLPEKWWDVFPPQSGPARNAHTSCVNFTHCGTPVKIVGGALVTEEASVVRLHTTVTWQRL